ncbi:prepilin peptidase [Candidatus Parcubacteria bacterium]|nr:prepilin peptidase [Candidatus Parcubacteria bacterium]
MLPALFLFLPLFVLGAIVGSFLNVVGLRYRSGLSLGGRSSCASCASELRWWELLPVASFFFLRGRCSRCKTPISLQYVSVEIFTGLVFATLSYLYWPIFALYIVIVIYDFRHKIIPDQLVYGAIFLSLLFRFYTGGGTIDWLSGPVLFALFGLGWLLSRGRALGFGDAKLALSVGLLLGGAYGLSAIVLSFWIGTAVTLPLMLFGKIFSAKRITIKSEIPFAPFMVAGAWVSLVFHLDILHVLSFFQ